VTNRRPLLGLLLLLGALPTGLLACATGSTGAASTPAGAASTPAPPEPTPLLAGAAVRVITPEVGPDRPPVRLAGFGQGRDATGVHDDLYARALVLEAGGVSVALVSLDLIGLFHDDVVKIREEARRRRPGMGALSILVASTHTHAGPDIIGLWTPSGRSVDPAYVATIRERAAEAVDEAWERRRPARVSLASADLPDLVTDSRRPVVIDATALLMKVESREGDATIATLLDFASHPESLGRENTLLSSDYPWAARRRLEREFGGVALFFSGDIGGLLTPLGPATIVDPETGETLTAKTPRATEAYGEAVARRAIAAWRAARSGSEAQDAMVTRGALLVRSGEIRVPLKNPRFLRGLAEGRIWPRTVASDGTLASEVAAMTILPERPRAPVGDPPQPLLQLACVPGELYPELFIGGIQDPQDPGADLQGAAREAPLRSMMSGRYRFVLGLCNDELGYIIPRSEWDLEPPFAYGLTEAQYGEMNSTGPDTAPTLLDAFRGILGSPSR
jgi:neutral/alkaline ceramidase-like enzyme